MISKRIEKRLVHEVSAALQLRDCRGRSKHAEKMAARKAAQDNHTHYTTITGLYATSSFSTYQKQALTALRWIAARHACRNIAECRAYVREYYDDMCRRGLSAWTIHTRVYALCAVYGEQYQDLLGVDALPRRVRADIVRGRTESVTDGRYHTEAQNDARTLARACGARRGGLMALSPDDLIQQPDGHYAVYLKEKGGKERIAPVLPQYEAAVHEIFARYTAVGGVITGGKQRLLPLTALPKNMALHRYRAEYAKALYTLYKAQSKASGERYYCRNDQKGITYDKGLLSLVSQALGHGKKRYGVVVSHYL
ncbi:MAG: hypothetical protein LKJ90_06795 [Faecalibacterium sp.]|jgi:hypothetical protein|nr:hypothetical protein [Faecalibacterium sp.]